MMGAELAIGELSRQTRCGIETIRYYERIGLLPPPHRSGGRFRRYEGDDVSRLRFIRRARQLGFTLDEVRVLMRLAGTADSDPHTRAEARRLVATHVAAIRAKIADLEAMDCVLSAAICECETGQQPRCPLIEVLSCDSVEEAVNA
jgi:MerR family mercuric resistance operon transcriptional regulator